MGWTTVQLVTSTMLMFISLQTTVSHASFNHHHQRQQSNSPTTFNAPSKYSQQRAPFTEQDIRAIQVCSTDPHLFCMKDRSQLQIFYFFEINSDWGKFLNVQILQSSPWSRYLTTRLYHILYYIIAAINIDKGCSEVQCCLEVRYPK